MKKTFSTIVIAMAVMLCLSFTAFANALGDVDGKDGINVSDARLCLRQAIQLEAYQPGDAQYKACDVDGDGAVTVSDARLILRYAIALDDSFPASGSEETTAEESTTAKDEPTTVKPEPTTAAPEPTTAKPEPTTAKPEPTTAKPEPTTEAHVHSWGSGKVTKAATCKAQGEKTFTCACGETKTEKLPVDPNAHSYKAVTVAATCTAEGYNGQKCEICGNIVKNETLPVNADAHKFINTAFAATCLGEGYTIDVCDYCDVMKESTYKKTAEPLGHNYNAGVVTAPTCTEGGYTVFTCLRQECGSEYKTNETPALGHDFSWKTNSESTCVTAGTKTGTCSRCKYVVTENQPLAAHIVSSAPVAVTGTGAGDLCRQEYRCTVCAKVIETVENSGHKWDLAKQIKTPQTCTEAATVTNTCKSCAAVVTVVNGEPKGHSAKIESTTAPTCTADGSIVYSGACSVCHLAMEGDAKTVVLPAKGHTTNIPYATCTQAVICTTCRQTVEPALGHDYSVESSGLGSTAERFYCNRCNALRADVLDAFNKNVNLIKLNPNGTYSTYVKNHPMTWFSKEVMTTENKQFDFGIYTSAVKSLYEEEMDEDTVTYSILNENDDRYYNLQVRYNPYVSELTAADIDSVKVERLSGITGAQILAGYDNTFTRGSTTYDISRYKTTKNLCSDVIKVTVDVKDETYSKDGGNVSSDPTIPTSLEKVLYYDVRDELRDYDNGWEITTTEGGASEGYEIGMTMTLKYIQTNAVVTYYFDASTMEPIAAVYQMTRVNDQSVAMKFQVGIAGINGTLQPVITTVDDYVYLSAGYFN